jgi:hypothetical protein
MICTCQTRDILVANRMLCQLSYAPEKELEPETGLEPATRDLQNRRSTVELFRPEIMAARERVELSRRFRARQFSRLLPSPAIGLPRHRL